MVFLQILKNAKECVFGRENRLRSSRERASERVLGRGRHRTSAGRRTAAYRNYPNSTPVKQRTGLELRAGIRGEFQQNFLKILPIFRQILAKCVHKFLHPSLSKSKWKKTQRKTTRKSEQKSENMKLRKGKFHRISVILIGVMSK